MKNNDVKIAIIQSEFNSDITNALLEGAHNRLKELKIDEKNIFITKVPGAVELPLAAKWIAKTKQYQAIICLGAVIRGDTDHYDYVCQIVSQGCLKVMLKFEIPVIFGVLMTHNVEQARERVGGKEGHKGKEAADAAFKMIEVMHSIC